MHPTPVLPLTPERHRRMLARLGRWLEKVRPALLAPPVSDLIDNRDILLTRENPRTFHVVLHRPAASRSLQWICATTRSTASAPIAAPAAADRPEQKIACACSKQIGLRCPTPFKFRSNKHS